MREFEILHKPSLVYNPTGNAICECIHRKVNAGLRIYQKENLKVALGKFQDGLRNICHKSLGTTPNNLVFSRNKRNSALQYSQAQLLKQAKDRFGSKCQIINETGAEDNKSLVNTKNLIKTQTERKLDNL